jgi:septal ring factor EnvC (AmiA/AmiB activator)
LAAQFDRRFVMNKAFQVTGLRRGFTSPPGAHTGSGHQFLWRAVAATALVFCAAAVGTTAYYGAQEARADSQQHSLQGEYERTLDSLRDIRSQVRNETGALTNARAILRQIEVQNAAAAEELARLRAEVEHLRGEKEALETSR